MPDTYSLREARERAGKSREKVAQQLGISAKTLERWEKLETRPRMIDRDILKQLAAIYDLKLGQIDVNGKQAA